MALYPLKFKPIVKPKVWGSESWLLSGYGEDQSIVANGMLRNNSLSEVLEIYMDELVGGTVYDRFGYLFPLLFKLIDAKDDLSVQVHPDDDFAAEDEELGKTEMWYVTHAENKAAIISGFNKNTNREEVRSLLAINRIADVLQRTEVTEGDVAFIPAGRVHALCKGVQVLEIQETSDITFRLYDYQRPGLDGQLRPLHVEQSLEVLDYAAVKQPLVQYEQPQNAAVNLINDVHFTSNLLAFDKPVGRNYAALDSFVVYLITQGETEVITEEGKETIRAGEVLLLPAVLNDIRLAPKSPTRLLEVYILPKNQ